MRTETKRTAIFFAAAPLNFAAVSYTHLHIIRNGSGKVIVLILLSLPVGNVRLNTEPVSYTHLDVYKRQPVTSPTRSPVPIITANTGYHYFDVGEFFR